MIRDYGRQMLWVLCLIIVSQSQTFGQKKKKESIKVDPVKSSVEPPKKDKPSMKAYGEVITTKAISDRGLFTVHKVDGKFYFEIADSLLSKREFLVSSKTSGFVENLDFGGAGMSPKPEQVVRWDKVDNRILLRAVSYNSTASEELPIYKSVKYNNFEPVLFSFDIQTISQDSSSYVIQVDDLFTTDIDFLGPLNNEQRKAFQIRNLDKTRSLITRMNSFPLNVEVRHVLTYAGAQIPAMPETSSLSVEMHQSFVLLPEKPMMPRLQDPRVGFFSVQTNDYGDEQYKTVQKGYITRWRLEPKDWTAYNRGELVEPVKPIVYYIDPNTPQQWRKYLKQGVEDWQQAFEKIGFKNAIVARDAPSQQEDPDWSPEDVRYSVIRYIATTIINAQGPHTHDPRSGEILESDILWYHNVTKWLRALSLTQTGAVNPTVRKPHLSEEDMGLLIRYVCAHEVGHTLGFPHNMGASAAYPVDSLRSATFTKQWGITPSIMDYARANYVAQPGDQGVHLLNNRIGPYDEYAVKWGYKPIPSAKSPEDERETLNSWITEKLNDPVYRFGRQTFIRHIDPRSQTEDLGDNAMKAGYYGIENLKRIVPNLIKWTTEPGRNYAILEESYLDAVRQWDRYLGHVVHNVGGVYETYKTSDQPGPVYEYVPRERQAEAVRFLINNGFKKPDFLLEDEILKRLEHAGAVERIRQIQASHLNLLLDPGRLAILLEAEALSGKNVYSLHNLLTDLRQGIWQELNANKSIDLYKRNLQRVHLNRYGLLMTEEQPSVPFNARTATGFTPVAVSVSDIRPAVRAELIKLQTAIKTALPATKDDATRNHLQDCLARIRDILDPK